MSWEVNYEGQPDPSFEISDKKMSETTVGKDANHRDTGKLYLIDRSEISSKAGKYVNPFHLEIYKRLRRKFEIGTIVPYAQIKELFPELKQITLSYRLTYLWANGYLDKYAKGTWGRFHRGYKKPEFFTRGKYFGVHYKILER